VRSRNNIWNAGPTSPAVRTSTHSQFLGGRLRVAPLNPIRRIIGISEHSDPSGARHKVEREFQLFSSQSVEAQKNSSYIAAGTRFARQQTHADGIGQGAAHNGNAGSHLPCRQGSGRVANHDRVWPEGYQLLREQRQFGHLAIGVALFEQIVVAFQKSAFSHALGKAAVVSRTRRLRGTAEKADDRPLGRHRRLLCPRRQRPSHRRAAKPSDELAPSHAHASRIRAESPERDAIPSQDQEVPQDQNETGHRLQLRRAISRQAAGNALENLPWDASGRWIFDRAV
jgi:hypothetical protein